MPDTSYVYNTNTTQLPPWMQTAIQDILNRATGVANAPYQPYGGPRVAPLSADQLAGHAFLRNNLTAYAPWLGAAGNFTFQGGSANTGAGGAPALGEAAGLYRDATSSPYISSAAGMYGNLGQINAGDAAFDNATDMFRAAARADTAGVATPLIREGSGYLRRSTEERAMDVANPYIAAGANPMGISMGSPYIQASTMGSGLGAAQPYLSAAATSFPGSAAAYMNPYTQHVTDRIAQLGARNLQENLLPEISDQFVRAGQFGSAQQRDVVGRALRDTQEAILAQQGQALERGYGLAGQLYGQDAGRYAGLAGTAGGLGTAQQQQLLAAGQSLGGLGQGQQQHLLNTGTTLGGLAGADLSRLAQAGVNLGQFGISQAGLAAQDQARALQAAFGISDIGQLRNAGQIATMQGRLQAAGGLGGLGSTMMNAGIQAGQGIAGIGGMQIGAAGLDASRALQAGGQMGSLANLQNNFVLQNAAGLGATGAEQQGQEQANLDVGYGDFLRQEQYPWQQLGGLSNIVQGQPMSTVTTGQGWTTTPSPSLVSQIGGLGLGAAGLANSGLFRRAQGGAVKKRYKRSSHSYGNVPRRGISFAEAA